jgi:hypothetical protein
VRFTFIGGLFGSTCKSNAVAAALVELLSIWRLGPATLPVNLVKALTVLVTPRLKTPPTPVPASAMEATPKIKASTSANPNTIEAVLPTHATFAATFLNISCSLSVLSCSV